MQSNCTKPVGWGRLQEITTWKNIMLPLFDCCYQRATWAQRNTHLNDDPCFLFFYFLLLYMIIIKHMINFMGENKNEVIEKSLSWQNWHLLSQSRWKHKILSLFGTSQRPIPIHVLIHMLHYLCKSIGTEGDRLISGGPTNMLRKSLFAKALMQDSVDIAHR